MLGDIVGLTSLLVISITVMVAVILAIRRNQLWKRWLMGTGAGVLLFIIALVITPGTNTSVNPDKPIIPDTKQSVPDQQQTTRSNVYKG